MAVVSSYLERRRMTNCCNQAIAPTENRPRARDHGMRLWSEPAICIRTGSMSDMAMLRQLRFRFPPRLLSGGTYLFALSEVESHLSAYQRGLKEHRNGIENGADEDS